MRPDTIWSGDVNYWSIDLSQSMLNGPSTLASVARLIGETLRDDHGIDPGPLYERCQIDTSKFYKPGSRILFSKMDRLWKLAVEESGDAEFGLKVGSRVVPGDFFVLGYAWLASETLLGALHRFARFIRVLSTIGNDIEIRDQGDSYALVENYGDSATIPSRPAMEAGFMAFLKMVDAITGGNVRPRHVILRRMLEDSSVDYASYIGCPVDFGDVAIWEFAASDAEAKLTGAVPDVADASDMIAEKYLESLDEGVVAHEVRQMIIQLLPSGRSDQDTIAKRLYRSRSTLQRQLGAEGTSYRQILESTRRSLAEKYLQSQDYTQAEIAFMLGFTDQSNFARAFKRWTGMSPGEYQKAA